MFFSHAINLTELNLFLGISQRMGENQQISVCLVFFVHHYYSVSSLLDIFLDKREKKERKKVGSINNLVVKTDVLFGCLYIYLRNKFPI
jgi:hypothetical protein